MGYTSSQPNKAIEPPPVEPPDDHLIEIDGRRYFDLDSLDATREQDWHEAPHREAAQEHAERTREVLTEARRSLGDAEKPAPAVLVVTRNSYLTAREQGLQVWIDLGLLVYSACGRVPLGKAPLKEEPTYQISERFIEVPEGDVEALIHDMCHVLTASSENAKRPNLGLDTLSVPEALEAEELAWALETFLFQPVMSHGELMEFAAPAEFQAHYWEPVGDPLRTTILALTRASEAPGLDVNGLRRVLARWTALLREKWPAEARPRGCCRWNGKDYKTVIAPAGQQTG